MTWLLGIGVVLVGLTTGGLAFMARGVATATPDLPAPVFVPLHQALYRAADPVMPVLVCSSTVVALALLIAGLAQSEPAVAALAGLSFVAMAIVIAITEVVNKPINKQVATWDPAIPPGTWRSTRAFWNRHHAYRTACGLVSLLGYVGAWTVLHDDTLAQPSLTVVTLTVVGVAAGGFFFMAAVVARATRALPACTYVAAQQALIPKASPYMTTLVVASALCSAALALSTWLTGGVLLALGVTAAFVGQLVVIAVSLLVNVPINTRVSRWSAASPPMEWSSVRDRWNRYHLLRTTVAVTAFALLAATTATSP